MFYKGTLRDSGIDITIKNNPKHVLSPDSWEKVMGVKFNKITYTEYKDYYLELIRSRWVTRKDEFLELAKKGAKEDIKLLCFCPVKDRFCHGYIAANFMNKLVEKFYPENAT